MDRHNKEMAKRNITLWLVEKYLADLERAQTVGPVVFDRMVDGKSNSMGSAPEWREKVHRLFTPELQALRPDLAERAAALGIELTTNEEA